MGVVVIDMRFSRLFSLGILFLLVAMSLANHVSMLKDAKQDLVRQFFDALNTKDKAKLTSFLQQHAQNPAAAADRAERLLGIANDGGPFKIVRFGPGDSDVTRALLTNRDGEELTVSIELSNGPNPKLGGLRLEPGDNLNPRPPKDFSGWHDLTALADAVRKDSESPAMGIAMIRDGHPEVAVSGARRLGEPAPVKPDDIWSVGSIGKPLCSTLIGKLIEQGKLRWDMTLAEALPGVPMKPAYRKVTLDQVMHHRGGIPEDPGMRLPEVKRIVGNAKTPYDIRTNYVKDILSRDPISPPDTHFAYSNAGYALLSRVVERATGKPYEEALRAMLFGPLGLKHSYIGADTYPKEMPSGHVPGPNGMQPVHFTGPIESMFAGAGGGIYMSVGDLAKFGEMHMNGLNGKDGFLKANTVQRLHRGVSEGGPGGRLYACGWGVENYRGIETLHGHNGSNGTFRAQLAIFPKSHLVVVAIVNSGGESEPSPGLQAVLAVASKYAKG